MATLASDTRGLLSFIPAEKIVSYLDKMICMDLVEMVMPADAEITP
ncbi:hypothetical protein PS850_06152 [Pseudomonas fluorescens]|nr:hypothetical protein PS850_06152 [Pseudomonas fluorescens]